MMMLMIGVLTTDNYKDAMVLPSNIYVPILALIWTLNIVGQWTFLYQVHLRRSRKDIGPEIK